MKLNPRERVIVVAGAIAVVAILGYRLLGGGAGEASMAARDTIRGAIQRIDEYARLERSTATLKEELNVEIAESAPSAQEASIREGLNRVAQQNGMQISTVRGLDQGSRARNAAVQTVRFRIEASGLFDSLMAFIYALENSKTPFVIREISIDGSAQPQQPGGSPGGGSPGQTATPQRRGRGGNQSSGTVRATMTLESYLFPEVVQPRTQALQEPQETETPSADDAATTGTQGASDESVSASESRGGQSFSGEGAAP